MGVPVLILGASGSGKSTSMRNFKPNEMAIFNVAGKPLPFKTRLPHWDYAGYKEIMSGLRKAAKKIYVIDDSQYLLAFESFDHAKERGYDKFTNMAVNFYNLIKFIMTQTSPDTIVYLMHHTELADDGKLKAKTLGKMLDNQLTVEGLFSIVLLCMVEGSEHFFITNSDGSTPAKSPMDMFDMKISNDLKIVDDTIRDYYGWTTESEETNGKAD